jgi:hypothetical protein
MEVAVALSVGPLVKLLMVVVVAIVAVLVKAEVVVEVVQVGVVPQKDQEH